MSHSPEKSPRPPRWCTAEAPAPRLAYNEAPEEYPGLPVRIWWRLFCLLWWRGVLADPAARRLARFLADTDTVAADGVIGDVPAMLRAYTARCHVSTQTAYTDLRRLVSRGLVRQVCAAAPGRGARYRLCAPAAARLAEIAADLPPALARMIARHQPAPADETPEGESAGPGQAGPDPASASSCAGLDTSPSTREGSPPSPSSRAHRRLPHRFQGRSQGIGDEERDHALSVLSACRGEWCTQRGPLGLPGPDELARLVPLTVVALRHVLPGEVRQLLTDRVASCRDLPGALAWRLGKVIQAARRPVRHVPADEAGVRYAAMLADPATGNSAPPAAVAEQLRHLRARLGPDRIGPRCHDDRATALAQAAAGR